jgi:hypothetical protein
VSQCHPERSGCFAKRSSYVVEEPALSVVEGTPTRPTLAAKYQGILTKVWAAQRFPALKARVETGLAPSQTADKLCLALDFGWRSASALRKDLPLSTNGKGTASRACPERSRRVPPRANKEPGFSP